MRALTIHWRSVWFSPYWRGAITEGNESGDGPLIDRIYYLPSRDRLRIYSGFDFDDAQIQVNNGNIYTMRKRGRFGRLYISR